MKDIAHQLGVSVATVSRALHGSPEISAERRKQIVDYARRLNFLPNAMAQQLRLSGRRPSKIVGVIVPELAHYYFSTVLKGIDEVCASRGYAVMIAESGEDHEREVEACRRFREHRVCGVIVSMAKNSRGVDHFQEFIDDGIPLVFYDRICTAIDTSRVTVDDYRGAFHAVDYLIRTGCRRIVLYTSPMNLEISKNRFNGYKDALLQAGLTFDERRVLLCDQRQQAEQLTPHVMAGADRPDAFFCTNDETAIGTLYTLKRLGLRVPDDVSLCGFTNGEGAISCDPMLTTVEQRGKELGRQAAEILLQKAEGQLAAEAVERRIVKTRLVVRGTTRPLAG
ncbi:MAG: LacI family transcriptional regulator [Prevotella sp.]|nr:LacI family transcriptional regulator [Prevotella sp.]